MRKIILPNEYEIRELQEEIRSFSSERMFSEDQANIEKAIREFVKKYIDINEPKGIDFL